MMSDAHHSIFDPEYPGLQFSFLPGEDVSEYPVWESRCRDAEWHVLVNLCQILWLEEDGHLDSAETADTYWGDVHDCLSNVLDDWQGGEEGGVS